MKDGQNPGSLRINNRRVVLDAIQQSKTATISKLSNDLGLSKTTLAKIINHFIELNLIQSSGKEASTAEGGKKAESYRFNDATVYTISIAIYEKFILAAVTDARANIFYKEKVHLIQNESIERVIEILSGFIDHWQKSENLPEDKKKSKLIGIAIAGSGVIDTEEGICFTASRFHSWPIDVGIKKLIKEKVNFDVPFYIDNYNRFYTFAEMSLRKHKKENCIVDIVTSYGGLGAGIIIDGKIHRGPRFLSGEIGHLCLDPNQDETCYCGGTGCFETLASSNRVLKKAREGETTNPNSTIYTSNKISLNDIFTAADQGDLWARELLDEVIKWFAIGIHNINIIYNPDVVIISGDYRTAGSYFKTQLANLAENQALLRMKKDLSIEYSELDDDGAITGAAGFILKDYFDIRFEY